MSAEKKRAARAKSRFGWAAITPSLAILAGIGIARWYESRTPSAPASEVVPPDASLDASTRGTGK